MNASKHHIKRYLLVCLSILPVSALLSQQTYHQFAIHAGIGKDIGKDNPMAGNIAFGYEFTPIRKWSFLSLEPRLCTSFLVDGRINAIDRWDTNCKSYGIGAALAPKLSIANDDRDFMLYLEYELSAVNYFSNVVIHQNHNTIYRGNSSSNTLIHNRWRVGIKLPSFLKDGKHNVGMGAWAGFTDIRMDNIIRKVTPDRFDKYFTNLPLDGEFGISFYF